jgi:hypothetical protein
MQLAVVVSCSPATKVSVLVAVDLLLELGSEDQAKLQKMCPPPASVAAG